MKHFLAVVLVLSTFSAATVGCAEKSTTTKETRVSTPGETTTIISQQQSESDSRQQGVFKDQQQNGANGQQQEKQGSKAGFVRRPTTRRMGWPTPR